MPNITEIIPPRVLLVDARTGMISREWYRFFFNQFEKAGGGTGIVPPDSGGTGTSVIPLAGQILIGNSSGTYTVANLTAGTGLFRTNGDGALTVGISNTGVAAGSYGSASSVTTLTVNAQGQLTVAGNIAIAIAASQIVSGTIDSARISGPYTGITGVGTLTVGVWNATTIGTAYGGTGQTTYTDGQLLIGNSTGNTLTKNTLTAGSGVTITNGSGAITIATSGVPITSAPVTKTADFIVAATEVWIINNKSGSTCTATLPSPATSTGRVLYFQNYQDQFLVSASSNVVPRAGGAAATAILADEAGDTTTLVSDGTNWVVMQYTPNNVLLLE
jgi:hypothetical protein